jgi:hypothetical protein
MIYHNIVHPFRNKFYRVLIKNLHLWVDKNLLCKV